MDIKLNARLSAYSKVSSVTNSDCEHDSVSFSDIDTLFDGTQNPHANCATTSDIDEMFLENSKQDNVVSEIEIDKLFGGV